MSVYPIVMSQGDLIKKENLYFPFEERGLQLGDGVYEVIRIYKGQLYLLNDHLNRLFRSLQAIKLTIPHTYDEIAIKLKALLQQNKMKNDGIIYLQVTRGSAPRTHYFPETTKPNIYAYVQDVPRPINLLKNGVTTMTHPDERWEKCYIKSLNLLPNVLARQKAVENNHHEAIFYNKENIITEGSASNIFLVKNNKVYTHPETKEILNGCVRMVVKRLCQQLNIPFIEERFTLFDIPHADELFLTSSISEVLPVTKVNDTLIKDGKVGEITKQLQHAYKQDANLI